MSDVLPFALPHATDAPAPLLVDARELAKLLGAGLRTVRTWDAAGRLPRPVRIGGAVRWQVEEIRSWIDAGCPCRATWEARRAART